MNDDVFSDASRAPAKRRSGGGALLLAALIGAVALGGAGGLWAADRLGWITFAPGDAPQQTASAPNSLPSATVTGGVETAQTALGVRMAELEQRMTRLNLQADAASGNAARAESLLVAAAARRAIERGAPLGYLSDQLKLRFGNAQPNAVQTLIEVSDKPVTLDALEQGLAALEPSLTEAPSSEGLLARVGDELSHLFVVRQVTAPSPAPQRRLERARMYVRTGRVEPAIEEIQRMPGRDAARDWIALAQRYVRAQRALDLIETAAILEPRQLNNANGAPVVAPTPGATAPVAPTAVPSAVPSAGAVI